MATRIPDGDFKDAPANGAHSHERAADPSGEDHSLLAEDPLTGLSWTETLLPLVTTWAGASAVHAVCLHFAGLGILANIPEFQSSHSLLRDATERLGPLMGDDDRLTRFSGNKLLIFSKRSDAGVRRLLVEISDRLDGFGTEIDGRHLPEVRVGMAMLGGRGPSAVTVEALNALMSDAAGVTIPMADVVTPRHRSAQPDSPPPAPEPSTPAVQPAASILRPHPEPTVTPNLQAAPHVPATPEPPAMHKPPAAPDISDHIPRMDEEKETTMITRGHPERTPIRPMVEAPALANAAKDLTASDHRLVLKAVDVAVSGLVATAMIDLDFEGRRVRGKAIGRSSEAHHLALVGEAMTRAVTDLLPAGHGAVFRQAVSASTDAGDVLVTVVEFLTPDRTEVLFGVAPTEGEAVAGVAKSVLHALNRATARLLGTVD